MGYGGYGGGMGYGGMGSMMGMGGMGMMGMGGMGMMGSLYSSPAVQVLYMCNQLVVAVGMLAELGVGNYRQWVKLRERIKEVCEEEDGEAVGNFNPVDRVLRQLFHPQTKRSKLSKAVRAAFFAAGMAGVVVVLRTVVERMVENRVKKRLENLKDLEKGWKI
jgi:hypothetical protein